jgi:hypothetical protein
MEMRLKNSCFLFRTALYALCKGISLSTTLVPKNAAGNLKLSCLTKGKPLSPRSPLIYGKAPSYKSFPPATISNFPSSSFAVGFVYRSIKITEFSAAVSFAPNCKDGFFHDDGSLYPVS